MKCLVTKTHCAFAVQNISKREPVGSSFVGEFLLVEVWKHLRVKACGSVVCIGVVVLFYA